MNVKVMRGHSVVGQPPRGSGAVRLVFVFLLFSAVGWLYEVALAFYYGWGFVNRGFLLGPYLPVYGFGGVLLLCCLTPVLRRGVRIGRLPVTPLVVFCLIVLIATGVEYAAGAILEALFHQRWWDYSHYPLNVNGLICLSASLRFGVGGMVFLYLLTPLLDRLLRRLPHRPQLGVAVAAVLVVAADFLWTVWGPTPPGA